MYLIYVDESGNSGSNLSDKQQPIFLLCAMILAEDRWLPLEMDLRAALDKFIPEPRSEKFEVHGVEVRNGRQWMGDKTPAERIAFRDQWMDLAAKHGVKIVYRAIEKVRYKKWITDTFPAGVVINPHVAAFALVSRVVDDYLKSLPKSPLGIFISDENKEIVGDVEKLIRLFRVEAGALRMGQIVEKGFFIQSHKSLLIQLCDLFAICLRKHEEAKTGGRIHGIDESGIARALKLVHRGDESMVDVLAWLIRAEHGAKKERPAVKPR